MNDSQRINRVKAMMYRFFSLYESQNRDFGLVEELLYPEGFVWNSPSGELVGIEAFPRIQKCDLTLKRMIEGGKFNDVYEKNRQHSVDFLANANLGSTI